MQVESLEGTLEEEQDERKLFFSFWIGDEHIYSCNDGRFKRSGAIDVTRISRVGTEPRVQEEKFPRGQKKKIFPQRLR